MKGNELLANAKCTPHGEKKFETCVNLCKIESFMN